MRNAEFPQNKKIIPNSAFRIPNFHYLCRRKRGKICFDCNHKKKC